MSPIRPDGQVLTWADDAGTTPALSKFGEPVTFSTIAISLQTWRQFTYVPNLFIFAFHVIVNTLHWEMWQMHSQ